ncbi:MAG TPA: SDR family NAD(P)-dependent oxidoreductase [Thermoanaerobaculia bacterium]|nr:SDR family NAD(P)-dependent oxidoreductase [Thermoanaerobaculia bacterium]
MKTLIVTGGTGGLGTTVVGRLARDYDCVLLGRDDFATDETLRAAVARNGAPYGLVHMAGGYAGGISAETWDRMMSLNLTLAFRAIRATLAAMRRDQPGRIVAISSEATITKSAGAAAYVVSKTALNALIEMTAAELAGTPITANALLPGTLDTPASRKAMPDAPRVPLERVAETIGFLLSDAGASVNGALIRLQATTDLQSPQ